MRNISEAKRRLAANISTNVLVVVISAIIGFWITSYLIRNLGVEVYGMIPLVISFIAYFNLFTMSISNAVSRYIAIHLNRGEVDLGSTYFSSAIIALIGLCWILFIPVIILSTFFSMLFQVPVGYEKETGWLFLYIISSSFITAITSPLLASTFITHRFDLSNIVKTLSYILRAGFLVLCFHYFSPSLEYVGVSYFLMALFTLVSSVALTRFLTPQLKLKWKLFKWSAIREMGRMSAWIAVNQVGALLYVGIGLLVIDVILGPEACGHYAPITLWITLLGTLGAAVSDVFTPIAFDYIAHNQVHVLAQQIRRATKFLAIIMSFPVGLLCGLSAPILQKWLGSDFADLSPLAWLLVGPWIVNISIRPMFAICRGLDKVKIPALVTIVGGLANVILSVLLVKHTHLGIYGIALSLTVCLVAKNLFFTPVYAAIITNQPKTIFLNGIVSGIVMTGLLSLSALGLSKLCDLTTIPRLTLICILLLIVYGSMCYFVVLKKHERALLYSLLSRSR